jgi:hypothetical protein
LRLPIIVPANREEIVMSAEPVKDSGDNEVEMVLIALRELHQKVTSPVIRACLETAYDDITHLVGPGEDAGQQP